MGEILTIQDCMARVMAAVREVPKAGRNEAQKFDFRGIDDVVNAVGPALRTHGVIVLPHLDSREYVALTSSKGTPMMCCRVVVTYRFVGPGGDFLEAVVPGESFDAGDKATAKAMSVAFRTALLQGLTLPTYDTDPDAETYEQAHSAPRSSPGAAVESPAPHAGSEAGASAPVAGEKPSGLPPDREALADGPGEGAPVGVSHYLSKDDQALLKGEWGGPANAIKAYQSKWPNVRRLADITYEMRDEMTITPAVARAILETASE